MMIVLIIPGIFYLMGLFYKILRHHHHSVLPKGRSFTANSGTKPVVLPTGRSSTTNSEKKVTVENFIKCSEVRCEKKKKKHTHTHKFYDAS